MSTAGFARRALVAACGAFALVLTVAGQNALAQRGLAVRNIRVDVSPLRASAGDPTAAWVEQELPRRLAQALAGRLTPKGGTLIVRIDTLSLGPNSGATIHGGSSPDNIGGVAMIGNVQWPVRATSTYYASPIDQTMIEQSNHYRVSQLVQALVYWLSRDL
jgi:predicted NBD/HSP70 family sugar kinase